jgi:aryl carrier-like protein
MVLLAKSKKKHGEAIFVTLHNVYMIEQWTVHSQGNLSLL